MLEPFNPIFQFFGEDNKYVARKSKMYTNIRVNIRI